MGKVALPEMRTYRYDSRLSTGAIAAGGTLGILIPPSTGFVIYAILTEESIGRLFLAGFFPGLLLTALFILSIFIQTRINPDLGPPGPSSTVMDRIRAFRQASAMIGVVTVTIGGIYAGLFTPTEAAGVGAFLAALLALVRGPPDGVLAVRPWRWRARAPPPWSSSSWWAPTSSTRSWR